MSDSGMSFIVCTFNGAARIPDVLRHLANQVVPAGVEYEVVLVDNASTDDTAGIARRCWLTLDAPAELRVVHEAQPGLSFARVAGIRAARFDILSFVDDDNWVAEDWCRRALERMRADPTLGAVGSRGVPEFSGFAPPVWFAKYQAAYAVGPQTHRRGRRLVKLYGAGLTVRKAALGALDTLGYTLALAGRVGTALSAGDDTELCFALGIAGWRLEYDPELVFRHVIPAKRLEKSYLLGLYRGFGRSSVTLDLYLWMAAQRNPASPGWLALTHWVSGLLITAAKASYWKGRSVHALLQAEEARLDTQVHSAYFSNRLFGYLSSWAAAREHAKALFAVFVGNGAAGPSEAAAANDKAKAGP
jgi:glycosyltransferase involved in cell wall biosynthesis